VFQDRQELAELIKSVMAEHNISMLDAILHICDRYKVEEELVASMIRQSHKLKEQLKEEAIKLKLVKQ